MIQKNFVHLTKLLDNAECNLVASSDCPVDFILHCLDEFKKHCINIKEEAALKEKPPE